MDKKTLADIDVTGRKVLVRVDYNVPLSPEGAITDDTRIRASLATIEYLLEHKAAVIILAHLGRPKGKIDSKLSLSPVAVRLAELLGEKVKFVDACVGAKAEKAAQELKCGEVLLLENLRFHAEEEKNDLVFAEKLAQLGDIYINDGFGVSHRAHASVEGITHFLPAVAGFLLEKELYYLGKILNHPAHPFAVVIGGAKVADKIGVIKNLLDIADVILLGGGMSNTFLAAAGCKMGKSLVEKDKLPIARELLALASKKNVRLELPLDLVMADSFSAGAKIKTEAVNELDQGYMALDIGPKTAEKYAQILKTVKTIFWNGPMGVFELAPFAKGTETVAKAVAANRGMTIVGGGDSAAALEKMGLGKKVKHLSTGGGASLECLEGLILPGVAALDDLRRPLIAGNWKCHKTIDESIGLAEAITELTNGTALEIVLFPAFTALESVAEAIDGKHVGYGAQDLYWVDSGAFTGAVSGSMVADIGCEYVLVGHSERRHIFGDNEVIVAKKVSAAFRNGLKPIICVGEDSREREEGKTARKISMQINNAFKGLNAAEAEECVVAYEPLWAIGSGTTATLGDVREVALLIRDKLNKLYGEKTAAKIRILYGGSVTALNAAGFKAVGVDGLLVGGASLKAEEFSSIVRSF